MNAITSVSINGTNYPAQVEYTNGTVTQLYTNYLQPFLTIIASDTSTGGDANISASTGNDVINALNGFLNLAKNGVNVTIGGSTVTQYMTIDMARNLNNLLASLKSATGFPALNVVGNSYSGLDPNQLVAPLRAWRDLSIQSPEIVAIVQSCAVSSLTGAHTLQSMVELDYVSAGNQILGSTMAVMQTALSNTQKILNTLTDLENLHNEISIATRSSNPFNFYQPTIGATAYLTAFNASASAYFGPPLTPTLSWPEQVAQLQLSQDIASKSTSFATYTALQGIAGSVIATEQSYSRQNSSWNSRNTHWAAWGPTGHTNWNTWQGDGYSKSVTSNISQSDRKRLSSYKATTYSPLVNSMNRAMSAYNRYTSNIHHDSAIAASAHLHAPPAGIPSYQSALHQLINLRGQLAQEIAATSALTPAASLNEPNSLLVTLRTVYQNINAVFKTKSGNPVQMNTLPSAALSGFSAWMLDNYSAFSNPSASSAGAYQQNIVSAITAGQSLYDSQKESVQNYLFIFEEYYKSASAILQQLTQIIEAMAKNIG